MNRLLPRTVLLSLWCVLSALSASAPSANAGAASCSRDDFAKAVDQAGAELRKLNKEQGEKVMDQLRALKKARKWSDADYEQKALAYLHDGRIAELDQKATELLSRIDQLGEVDEGKAPDCKRLPELQAAGRELLEVVREKSRLTLAKIDVALRDGGETAGAARPPPSTSEPAPAPRRIDKPAAGAGSGGGQWSADTRAPPVTGQASPSAAAQPRPAPRDDYVALQPPPPPTGEPGANEADTYTIDEIRAATRGFFGTISTNLASVIEYAFSNYGRPTAYVLGSEGGGAFLAGVRYGKGDLYMRAGERRTVYWHGPSIGYDFGAEGSRTLYLIYRLKSADDLFRRYGGVDGSAYVLGGVGLTLLKGGPVLMAPIRTGVGLRLGANVGYVRFSPTSTWNPF